MELEENKALKMTPTEYFDNEPSEEDEPDINELIKKVYEGFMHDMEIAASIARQFPDNWQIDILMNIMRDI